MTIVPPEHRVTIDACHPGCQSCDDWSRNGGACPGVEGAKPASNETVTYPTPLCWRQTEGQP